MKKLISGTAAISMVILFLGCEENLLTKNSSPEFTTQKNGGFEGPGGYSEHSNGDSYPYPEIIHEVIVPNSDIFNRKTLAWRITWPTYADDADPEKIPTLWSGDGILHSIDYLNNVDPQNTYNSLFSMYFDETIQRSADMATELVYVAGAPKKSMELVTFNGNWTTAKGLQLLTQWDAGFHMYWQVPNPVEALEYEDEDILWYRIGEPAEYPDKRRYGAIRIVSMEPRIIEIFLAVPNNLSSVDDFAS